MGRREIMSKHVTDLECTPTGVSLEHAPEDPAAVAARSAAHAYYRRAEARLEGSEFFAGAYGYADIAFYMAQLFGERKGAPIGSECPRLLEWRERVGARPAVAQVACAMGRYLASAARPVPEFLARLMR